MAKQNKKEIKETGTKQIKKACCSVLNCNSLKNLKNNFLKKTPKQAYMLIAILFVLILLSYLFGSLSDARIKRWVDKNPETILNSVNKFVSEKQKEIMEQRQKMATEGVKTRKKEIQDTKYSGVVNPKGSVTVVEFFDYNCGYCKHVSKIVEKIAKEDKSVRFIFKELPIMGESSREAAKNAIAVSMINPEKYMDFHSALMTNGAKGEEDFRNAANKAGIKYSSIESILKSKGDKIDEALNKNLELAGSIGINGTPAFIIEDEFVPGALDYDSLIELIGKAKK